MRRTIRTLRILWAGPVFLALFASGLASRAQDPLPTAIIVPKDGYTKVQMTGKRPLTRVEVVKEAPRDNVSIRNVQNDPTTIIVNGLQKGVTTIKLSDMEGNIETIDLIVQMDLQAFQSTLRQIVPRANITATAIADNVIALTGTVSRAEDVPFVTDVAKSISSAQILPNGLRIGGVQQVQLDVVIALVARNEFRGMAFNFLADSPNFFFANTVGNAVAQPGAISTIFPVGALINNAPGTPNNQPTNMLFGVLHNSYGFLGFLQALRTEGVAKTLAHPTLTTMSGTPGSFLAGGEQAVPIPAGLGQVGVQFEDFGTRLNYLPIVLGNGKIRLEVEPEISALSAANGTVISGATVPGRVTNRAHATVELEAGQTFVMAGLVQHDLQASTQKVPVLGDLPFVGTLFSANTTTETEQEIVILVTPYLVDGQDCFQLTKCLPGQESRTPDDLELFLEGILEAPRGPREVFQDHHYVPAFKSSTTSEMFPCGGNGCGRTNGAPAGCLTNTCGPTGGAPVPPPGPAPLPVPRLAPPIPAESASPASLEMPLPEQAPMTPAAEEAEPAAEEPAPPAAPAEPEMQ